jgi:hypothetical protein
MNPSFFDFFLPLARAGGPQSKLLLLGWGFSVRVGTAYLPPSSSISSVCAWLQSSSARLWMLPRDS